ncbi:MAG: dephospho-CoA kinase [Phycisphaerae bacterium]|nr:dephospho-CoA kinase [Phycisphaerae bacterium]
MVNGQPDARTTPLRRIPVIGIVGGIGSGKSAVAEAFRGLGCIVSDSDRLAHEALRDPSIRAAVVARHGRAILDDHGEIDRKALGRIVFADREARTALEALVHPYINTARERLFATATPTTPACVIDAPLLLEAGLGPLCDAIVFVDAPHALRLARVASRGWDEAELARREAAQWSLPKKRAASTDVVENVGDRAALVRAAEGILSRVATR